MPTLYNFPLGLQLASKICISWHSKPQDSANSLQDGDHAGHKPVMGTTYYGPI